MAAQRRLKFFKLSVTYAPLSSSNLKTNAMRKQVLSLTLLVTMLIIFTTVAYSHYKVAGSNMIKESSCKKTDKGEILFESLMKQFVGAVKL